MGKGKATPMTPKAAARIQAAAAKDTNGKTAKADFAKRAQAAGAKNTPNKAGKK